MAVADSDPTPAPRRREPLSGHERRLVAAAGVAPVGLAVLVLVPFALLGSASGGDVALAALVYGGLLGLAAAFVAVDRLHARQCPRCATRNLRGATACEDCGYDLVRRPRYACEERHEVYLEPGLCDCGRRALELPVARGIGPEIRWMVRAGAWLFAFLVVVWAVLALLSR